MKNINIFFNITNRHSYVGFLFHTSCNILHTTPLFHKLDLSRNSLVISFYNKRTIAINHDNDEKYLSA